MNTHITRSLTVCVLIAVAVLSVAIIPGQFTSDVFAVENNLNMGAILDNLLWPKAVESIEPVSQWTGRTIITSDNNAFHPPVLMPAYAHVTGTPDPADTVFYVMHTGSDSAFGSVTHENVTYNYWQHADGVYMGPLEIFDLPYIIDLPLDVYWDAAPQMVHINMLKGIWGADSVYLMDAIAKVYRIYYDVASETPADAFLTVEAGADQDGNATPDAIFHTIGDFALWSGQSENRGVLAASLDFADDTRIPGQVGATARFKPLSNFTVDLPITQAFYDAGLAEFGYQIFGVMQTAYNLYATIDAPKYTEKASLDAMPGTPLFDDVFFSLHYFQYSGSPQPIQEITPLAAAISVQYVPLLELPDPAFERLALWRYPITLDPLTGQYSAPGDGAYALALADNITLTDNTLSATLSQDGLIVPLITELWVDEAFPPVLAADSERPQPLVLTGVFATWMGAAPELGVTPGEADLQYEITIDDILSFRTPENDIDGFSASYAISPTIDVQEPNRMYLWTPTHLTANEQDEIILNYTNAENNVLIFSAPVSVKNTALISMSVTTNVPVTPAPARVSLTPEQSSIQTATGDYPLEAGRFFTEETVTASIEVDAGWGLVRWLRDAVEVATTETYEFEAGPEDATVTAEVASYALTANVQPGAECGVVVASPSPVPDTPGYAPGTEVQLEAQPAPDYAFAGWAGGDAIDLNINPDNPHIATLVMDADKTIEAIFEEGVVLLVTAVPPDGGDVFYRIDDGEEIPFPLGQTVNTPLNSTVTLRAVANTPEYSFEGWLVDGEPGETAPDGSLSLTMDASRHVEALFNRQVALSASVQPPDSGMVLYSLDEETASPFPDTGVLYINEDATVTLFAEPTSEPFRLREWLVDGEPGTAAEDGSLQIVMDADKSVVATFGRLLQLTLEPAADGQVEIVSPTPEDCGNSKQTVYCFWENTEITLSASAFEPDIHVLNAWHINGLEIDGTSGGFGETYTFAMNNDAVVAADFKRKLRVDSVSLTSIPVNRSVPLALTGVFPTWMSSDAAKFNKSLTAEEAEERYEILMAGAEASFLTPEETPFTSPGQGILPLDEADPTATNIAYVWSPELVEIPADMEEIPVAVRDRINPLNIFDVALPREVFVDVVTLTVEVLPENTAASVLVVPERGGIPAEDGSALSLSAGEYIAGDSVALSAIPPHALAKFRIITDSATEEITAPDYELTIMEDTRVVAMFESDAYRLTLVPSDYGDIIATPASSPGWPTGWYEAETEVSLAASPNPGCRFVSWTHDLAGEYENPVVIVMDADIEAGALYLTPENTAINILPAEGGDVILQPEGLVDPANPNVHVYSSGTTVRITGRPAAGFRFDQWRILDDIGDRFLSDNPLELRVAQDFVIEPLFVRVFNLDISAEPEDAGEIIVSPPQPASGYDAGMLVSLTAVPDEERGYRFIQWTGENGMDVRPNSTTATVALVMDDDKQLVARFSKIVAASIEPAETWTIGGIVAKVTGEALANGMRVRFGDQEMPLFDVAPSGQYAFVEVPPLIEPGDAASVKVALAILDGDVAIPYAPGFTYKQREINGSMYTAAFTATVAGNPTPVFVGRIGGRDAVVTLPPLGEAPVYGIVRVALPGVLAASRSGVVESMPGATATGLYDVAVHLYTQRVGVAVTPQYGLMSYQDATDELLALNRPYRISTAEPLPVSEPARLNMAVQPDAEPSYAAVRTGISLWGVKSSYDYLYNAELTGDIMPTYQSTLQNEEVLPANDATLDEAETIRALSGARIYGGEEDTPANCFTWRQGAVLPVVEQRAIKISAIDNMPVKGTGSGPVAGGTTITLTSPYGGLAWIDSIELAGISPTVGGKVAVRDLVSVQGEDEFLLEFKTPRSARPGMTSVIIRTAANPEEPIVLQNVFEYTRPPIRWWLILLILIGLMLGVIGMATGF